MTRWTQKNMEELLSVYFIMGSTNCQDKNPVQVLEEAIEGGITLFQYREKGPGALVGSEKRHLGENLQRVCRDANIPFIVNDDVDLAIDLDADGIHVGQDDANAREVRERIPGKLLGVSAHTVDEGKQAIADGADYLGVGPIYQTSSKSDAKEAQGAEVIKRFRDQQITIPIVGIGGITTENAHEVIQAGGNGVSVISAIANTPNVQSAAAKFKEITILTE